MYIRGKFKDGEIVVSKAEGPGYVKMTSEDGTYSLALPVADMESLRFVFEHVAKGIKNEGQLLPAVDLADEQAVNKVAAGMLDGLIKRFPGLIRDSEPVDYRDVAEALAFASREWLRLCSIHRR